MNHKTEEKGASRTKRVILRSKGKAAVLTRADAAVPAVSGPGLHDVDSKTLPTPVVDRYQELLDCIYDAVVITSAAGEIVLTNRRLADFILCEPELLKGTNVVDIIQGAGRSLLATICQNLHEKKYMVIDCRCVRRDGSEFPAEIAVSEFRQGDNVQLCFFIRDLTVREQAENALKEALQRLEGQDKARSLFISSVTHELRTPLTSMTYGITNLLKGIAGPVSDGVREYLERFERECRRLLTTVNDILDIEKIQTGSIHLAKVKMPVAFLVTTVTDSLEPAAMNKNVSLIRQAGKIGGFVYCDVSKMQRCLLNVLDNAIKYTPSGGRVSITFERRAEHQGPASIKVEDTGIGIPVHALSAVAQPYFRAGGHADGSGLGLTIVKEMIEMHGGSLEIQSPPPGSICGTLVSIHLAETAPATVLIVAADESVVARIVDALHPYGYQTTVAGTASEALANLREKRPDVAVVDFCLPDMDGIQLIVSMYGDQALKGMPVVLTSASDVSGPQKEILSSLAVPMVIMPCRDSLLFETVALAAIEKGTNTG